jgi:hypothetical protein
MTEQGRILEELNDRSREVFRRVVEGYLETGAPVGSRTLTRSLSEQVSAATVRNVMQDLEFLGLAGQPAYLGRACADATGPAPVRRRVPGGRRSRQDDRQSLDRRSSRTPPISRACWIALDPPCRPRRRAQAWSLRRNTRRRSSISISCPCPPNRRLWCSCFPTAMSKTAFSTRRRHHTQRHAGGREFPERASWGRRLVLRT